MFPPKQGLTLTRSRTTSGRWRRRRRRGRSTPFPRTGSAARTSSWKPLPYGLFLYYAKHLFYPILRWLSFRMKEKYFNDVRAKQADRLYAVLGIRIELIRILLKIFEKLGSGSFLILKKWQSKLLLKNFKNPKVDLIETQIKQNFWFRDYIRY